MERFAAAAMVGFSAVEFLFPYDHPPEVIGERLRENGLTVALFNLPPGNWAATGERGLAALDGRQSEFRTSVDTALRYARSAGARTLHVMSGLGLARGSGRDCDLPRLRAFACDRAGECGIDIVIEPINPRDMPGIFSQQLRLCCRHYQCVEEAKPEVAIRHLSSSDHSRRRAHGAPAHDAAHRPRTDCFGAAAQRARNRRA